MKSTLRIAIGLMAGIGWILSDGARAAQAPEELPADSRQEQNQAQGTVHGKEATVTTLARGTFDVKLTPQASDEEPQGSTLGRMALEKQFHGDLEGTSRGEMLSATTPVEGSAGYVAIERVRGALQGRTGTFALQHSGTLTRGEPRLTITVVPDSGTGRLAGLTGHMTIRIEGGKHFYELAYTLPGSP